MAVLCCSQALAQNAPQGWVATYRPGGELFVPHPPGWGVQDRGGGAFLVFLPGTDRVAQAFAFVKPQRLGPGRGLPDILGLLPREEAALFPGARLSVREEDVRQHEAMGELRFAVGGRGYRGRAAVVANGPVHGTLFALGETEQTWPTHAQTAARILRGFAYMPPAATADDGGAHMLPAMQTWRDPNEGAFALPVPQGWHVQGGLLRPGGIDLRAEVVVTSPDEGIQVRLGDAKVPTFGAPYQVPFVGTTAEGTVTAGGTVIWRYLPGDAFLTQFYLPRKFGAVQNVRARSLPALAEHSFRAASPPPPMRGRADAGEAAFEVQIPAGPRQLWYAAVTRYSEVPGLNASGAWSVETLVGVSAVAGRTALAHAVLAEMHRGFTWNPQWVAAELRMRGEVAQAVIAHNSAMNGIVAETARIRAHGGARAAAPRAMAARGTITVQGSDGQTLVVPQTGSQDYFRVRQTGDVVHGDRLDLPPFDYDRMWRVP
jgi:hypothetical protein